LAFLNRHKAGWCQLLVGRDVDVFIDPLSPNGEKKIKCNLKGMSVLSSSKNFKSYNLEVLRWILRGIYSSWSGSLRDCPYEYNITTGTSLTGSSRVI